MLCFVLFLRNLVTLTASQSDAYREWEVAPRIGFGKSWERCRGKFSEGPTSWQEEQKEKQDTEMRAGCHKWTRPAGIGEGRLPRNSALLMPWLHFLRLAVGQGRARLACLGFLLRVNALRKVQINMIGAKNWSIYEIYIFLEKREKILWFYIMENILRL